MYQELPSAAVFRTRNPFADASDVKPMPLALQVASRIGYFRAIQLGVYGNSISDRWLTLIGERNDRGLACSLRLGTRRDKDAASITESASEA